ncbi:hypothetical protein [Paraconexibacter sp. AEG42_29]|uniref:hypothetical protein n=1 Tax=Paraconexibacter sp. AEG42_29 TaxID=2997339 RepID=UPI00339D3183
MKSTRSATDGRSWLRLLVVAVCSVGVAACSEEQRTFVPSAVQRTLPVGLDTASAELCPGRLPPGEGAEIRRRALARVDALLRAYERYPDHYAIADTSSPDDGPSTTDVTVRVFARTWARGAYCDPKTRARMLRVVGHIQEP